jgi:hypothetical protein
MSILIVAISTRRVMMVASLHEEHEKKRVLEDTPILYFFDQLFLTRNGALQSEQLAHSVERFSKQVVKPQIHTRSSVMCALRASESSFGVGC